uniref:Protein-export membrane protein SecG n=1 Tax=Panagrellus redivivus TaxID=6233 RepID=A0A7E4VDL0_PANRE
MNKLLITLLLIALAKDVISNTTTLTLVTDGVDENPMPKSSLANKYTFLRQSIIIIVIAVLMLILNAVLYKFTFETLKTPEGTTTSAPPPQSQPVAPSSTLAESQSRKSDGASTK